MKFHINLKLLLFTLAFTKIRARFDIEAALRNNLIWLLDNTILTSNEIFYLFVASGTIENIVNQQDINYQREQYDLQSLLVPAQLRFPDDEMIKRFSDPKKWDFVAQICNANYLQNVPRSNKTAEEIYQESSNISTIMKCANEGYIDNAPQDTKLHCVIRDACLKEIIKDPFAPGMAVEFRNQYYFFSKFLILCDNFDDQYNQRIRTQASALYSELHQLLAQIVIPDKHRTVILTKAIYGVINGYSQFLNRRVLRFVRSLYNPQEGYCGKSTDSVEDKSILTAQCFTLLVFEVYLRKCYTQL